MCTTNNFPKGIIKVVKKKKKLRIVDFRQVRELVRELCNAYSKVKDLLI